MLYYDAILMFLKVLMLIRQVHLKNVLFVAIGIFWIKYFKFQSSVCIVCHDVLMMPIGIISIAIWNFYCCIIVGITKKEIANLLRKTGLMIWVKERLFDIYLIIYKNG